MKLFLNKKLLVVLFFITIFLNVFSSLYMIFTGVLVKQDEAQLLTAVSMKDYREIAGLIAGGSLKVDDVNNAFQIALRHDDAKLLRLLMESEVEIDMSEKSYMHDLFSYNSVDTIKMIIPNIEYDLYKDRLGRYIAKGLLGNALYLQKRQGKSEKLKSVVARQYNVSKYMINVLASNKDIVTALSGMCSGDKIHYHNNAYRKDFESLIKILITPVPEAAIGCVLKETDLSVNNISKLFPDTVMLNKKINIRNINSSRLRNFDGMSLLEIEKHRVSSRRPRVYTSHYLSLAGVSDSFLKDRLGNYIHLNNKNSHYVDNEGRSQLMLTMLMDPFYVNNNDIRVNILKNRFSQLRKFNVDHSLLDNNGKSFLDYVDLTNLKGFSMFSIAYEYYPEEIKKYLKKNIRSRTKLIKSKEAYLKIESVVEDDMGFLKELRKFRDE